MKITEKQLRKYISESIKKLMAEEFDWERWDSKSKEQQNSEINKIIRFNNRRLDGNFNDMITTPNGNKMSWKSNSKRCLWTKHNNPNGSDEEREVYNNLKKMPLKQAVAESVDKAFNKVLNEMHYSDFKALGQGGPVSDYTEVLKRYQFSPELDFESIDLNQFRNISKGSQAFFYISILTPDGKMWQSNITTRSERKAFHMAQRITDDLRKTNWLESLKSAGLLDDKEGYGFIEIGYVDGAYLNGMEVDTDCCGSYNYDSEDGICFWND